MATMWLSVVVNAISIFAAIISVGRWFRRWLRKTVSEPIKRLELALMDTKDLAQRAHDRLDRHLETHNG